MKKKLLIVLAILIFAGSLGIGHYFVNYALSPVSDSNERKVKEEVKTSNQIEALIEKNRELDNQIGKQFYKETSETSLRSHDGLKLSARYKTQESHQWALVIHGYKSTNKNMMGYGKEYYDHGYNVLLPDDRASGKSEGKYIGMGWLDKNDMKQWVSWICEKDPQAEIVVHGVSMGGATTMMLSGMNPKNVVCYIEDCGYTSVWDIFASELKKRFSLPEFPVMNVSNIVSNIEAGYSFKEASALKEVKKCEKPMLFIHGTKDDFVPYGMGRRVYRAARCKKELYSVKGATHANSLYVNPDKYWNHVFRFIHKNTELK